MFKGLLKQYPALSFTTVSGIVAAVAAVWESANSTGTTNWWLLTIGLVPIVAGALTTLKVTPVDRVRSLVRRARSMADAAEKICDALDVALDDRPVPTAGATGPGNIGPGFAR